MQRLKFKVKADPFLDKNFNSSQAVFEELGVKDMELASTWPRLKYRRKCVTGCGVERVQDYRVWEYTVWDDRW